MITPGEIYLDTILEKLKIVLTPDDNIVDLDITLNLGE